MTACNWIRKKSGVPEISKEGSESGLGQSRGWLQTEFLESSQISHALLTKPLRALSNIETLGVIRKTKTNRMTVTAHIPRIKVIPNLRSNLRDIVRGSSVKNDKVRHTNTRGQHLAASDVNFSETDKRSAKRIPGRGANRIEEVKRNSLCPPGF